MSCPTCDHAMNNLGQNDRGDNLFHCPRCGTVEVDAFGQHGDKVYVPQIVGWCWPLAVCMSSIINRPEGRPK